MEKILLDTDIGSDIDDSYCLAYLLKHPDSELMGVTTVSGEAMERAKIADAICRVAGKAVPIYCGSVLPLSDSNLQPVAKQKAALPNWPHAQEFPYGAAEFMNRIITENPGEVTLVAVGPLTNVAVLFTQYPNTPRLLKKLVLMSGAFFGEAQQGRPKGEWNVRCDVRASRIVYQADVPELRLLGLDVTKKVRMKQDEIRANFTSPVLKTVEDFSRLWFEEREDSAFHDPLAAVSIFEPDICTWKRGSVAVEPVENGGGISTLAEDERGTAFVADTVNAAGFFEHFFKITRG